MKELVIKWDMPENKTECTALLCIRCGITQYLILEPADKINCFNPTKLAAAIRDIIRK